MTKTRTRTISLKDQDVVVVENIENHDQCFPTFLCFPVDMFASGIMHLRLILRGWACMRVHKNDIWASGRVVISAPGGDEVHTLRLILNNFLIAGTQLFHSDCNLFHSIDMVVRLVCYQIYFILTYFTYFTKGFVILSTRIVSFLDFNFNTNITMFSPVFFL